MAFVFIRATPGRSRRPGTTWTRCGPDVVSIASAINEQFGKTLAADGVLPDGTGNKLDLAAAIKENFLSA